MTRRARAAFEEIINAGRAPVGAFVMSTDPNTTTIYGRAGYDWVLIDREHGIMDESAMRAHLLAADATGLVPIVRVLHNSSPLIQQALDAGAQGVLVPKIGSADDAARAVAATRYAPGGRGMCPVVPAAGFSGNGWGDYASDLNGNVILMPLIESRAGVDNIDEICAVKGVDYIFFGLADLSQDMGIDMLDDADTLIGMWEKVVAAARRHGVRAGAPLGYGFDDLADFGSLDSDLGSLRSAADLALTHWRERPQQH
ncbi:HpcH/HpaI aldolase family protein [Streptomyces arenae]|uniref:HpcH/HpaI aldolase family protein n=1 Tax=Streptomyces arenae TaxID=29301 RepID=UPI00265B2840|nr:aldolase/citrate lyase family protein [Streptomyces arenae]MCG7207371.1 aldolase/citrate lyase family protein [Streptomyces arenae]